VNDPRQSAAVSGLAAEDRASLQDLATYRAFRPGPTWSGRPGRLPHRAEAPRRRSPAMAPPPKRHLAQLWRDPARPAALHLRCCPSKQGKFTPGHIPIVHPDLLSARRRMWC
jgi:hypothetical protein